MTMLKNRSTDSVRSSVRLGALRVGTLKYQWIEPDDRAKCRAYVQIWSANHRAVLQESDQSCPPWNPYQNPDLFGSRIGRLRGPPGCHIGHWLCLDVDKDTFDQRKLLNRYFVLIGWGSTMGKHDACGCHRSAFWSIYPINWLPLVKKIFGPTFKKKKWSCATHKVILGKDWGPPKMAQMV